MSSKCGHVFSNNNEYQPILKNKNNTKRLMKTLERFDPGNLYNNQVITIGPKNSLYYGLYKLPNNIKNPRGNSLINISSPRRIQLSELLKIISNQTNNRNISNVIGVFCRDIAHFGKGVSYAKKRGKGTLTVNGNNFSNRYTTLRPLTAKRRRILNARNIIKSVMNRVPRGTVIS
jgi:hypothetical protein